MGRKHLYKIGVKFYGDDEEFIFDTIEEAEEITKIKKQCIYFNLNQPNKVLSTKKIDGTRVIVSFRKIFNTYNIDGISHELYYKIANSVLKNIMHLNEEQTKIMLTGDFEHDSQ